jgi:hypothetical protein
MRTQGQSITIRGPLLRTTAAPETFSHTREANAPYAFAASLSGAEAAIGVPASAATLMSSSNGISPRNSVPSFAASVLAPP